MNPWGRPHMTSKNAGSRKRGVRASRAHLYRALADAGLRSQAELAARMADLEQLENEPLSLVNRVFREQPVEPGSLERVARALDVDAWTLYLTEQVESGDAYAAPPSPEPGPEPVRRRWISVALAATLVLAFVALAVFRAPSPSGAGIEASPTPRSEPGRPSVAVLGFEDDTGLDLAGALRERLEAEFSVVMGSMESLAEHYGEREAAERLRAQWLIGGEHVRHGRWSGIRIWLEHDHGRVPGWTESLPTAQLRRDRESIVDAAFAAIRDRISGREPAGDPVIEAGALNDYLIGRMHLDRATTELNVRRAQGRFQAAIRREPDFARAYAGLCLALLEEIWIQDEQWALEQAGSACREAESRAPGDRVVQLARAALSRRSGEIEAAIELLESAIARAPRDADLLNLMATLHFHRYRQTGESGAMARARAAAIDSAEADPAFWKPLFTRAIIEYFDNDIDAAVAASRNALALEENTSILTNLGSFELCAGEIEQARERYLRVRELAPEAHAGDEFLGLVHYYQRDYETSRRLRQRAIDSLAEGSPEIHQMWAGLAESRWRSGQVDAAAEAWLRAIEIVERDRLRGTAGMDDDAARIYYYTALARLNPAVEIPDRPGTLKDGLEEVMAADLSANALVNVAKAWRNLGHPGPAGAALARAAAICPGYAALPEFENLQAAGSRPGDADEATAPGAPNQGQS